jgi:hypothetical protein
MRPFARWLASSGLVVIFGVIGYLGILMLTGASAVGPVVARRAVAWLALQGLTVAVGASTVLLAVIWLTSIKGLSGTERARLGVLLTGAVVFLTWAAYWDLLVP